MSRSRSWFEDAAGLIAGPHGTRVNRAIRLVCRPIYEVSHRITVLGRQHADLAGGYLLAANHHHPMDIPGLMYATPRLIEFVSTVNVIRTPVFGSFYKLFRPIPLNRGVVDSRSVKAIVDRLKAGRVIGIFPEAGIKQGPESVTEGGPHRAGFGRIARLADVPVIPTVILESRRSMAAAAWLPLRRTRFGVAFGEPLLIRPDLEPRQAQHDLEERWRSAVGELTTVLRRELETPPRST